jgi:hypothetical protein
MMSLKMNSIQSPFQILFASEEMLDGPQITRGLAQVRTRFPDLSGLHLVPAGLVLGAGTVLVPAHGARRLTSLDGQEARVLALLSAAYRKAGGIESRSLICRGRDPMNEIKFNYSIRSELPVSPQSPASLGAKFVDTLDALSSIDPAIFADWQVMDLREKDSVPLAKARSRIGAIIERNVTRDDFGCPEPYYGYSAVAFTSNSIKSRKVHLRIKVGGQSRGDAWLQTGDWQVLPNPAIVTYPLFKAALFAINAIWPPIWACAYAFRSNTVRLPETYPGGVQGYRLESLPMVPDHPTFKDSVFHIPWIAYISTPLAAGVMLPPEIITEQTPDGGLLMVATKDRLDPDNPEHLQRARLIVETMLARTGSSTYATHRE